MVVFHPAQATVAVCHDACAKAIISTFFLKFNFPFFLIFIIITNQLYDIKILFIDILICFYPFITRMR
jgi:hypothetical protein